MKKVTLQLTENQMRRLAEMIALSLSALGIVRTEVSEDEANAWQQMGDMIMNAAHQLPSIAEDMAVNPDLRHWFFNDRYAERSFYTHVLDEFRDAIFWSELVGRMADHTIESVLPPDELESLSDEERQIRLESLEAALWQEVTHHGIDRLVFILPPEDS